MRCGCARHTYSVVRILLARSISTRTHYEILGVKPVATKAEIKKAFIELSKKYHPDVSANPDPEQFSKVAEAYAILGHQKLRESYDVTLKPTVTSVRHSDISYHRPTSYSELRKYRRTPNDDFFDQGRWNDQTDYEFYNQRDKSNKRPPVRVDFFSYLVVSSILGIGIASFFGILQVHLTRRKRHLEEEKDERRQQDWHRQMKWVENRRIERRKLYKHQYNDLKKTED